LAEGKTAAKPLDMFALLSRSNATAAAWWAVSVGSAESCGTAKMARQGAFISVYFRSSLKMAKNAPGVADRKTGDRKTGDRQDDYLKIHGS